MFDNKTDAELGSRFAYPIPREELERRWKVIGAEMEKQGIDVLVMYAFDRILGGTLKYVTDLPMIMYPAGALFSPKDGIFYIGHGDEGGCTNPPWSHRGITADMGTAFLPTLGYTDDNLGRLAVQIIKDNGYKKIGFCGMNTIPTALYLYIVNHADCEFVNFSRTMDYLKAVKSDLEVQCLRRVDDILDTICNAVPSILQPGMRERDFSNDVMTLARRLDAEEFNILTGTGKNRPNTNVYLYQNELIQKGDNVSCLIEFNGPGGYYGEIARQWSLGGNNTKAEKAFYDSVDCQLYCTSFMKPGVTGGEIFAKMNEWLTSHGYFPEKRFAIHGQGYDMVESPCMVPDEEIPLEKNMFLAVHPNCVNDEAFGCCCDNYLITETGVERLNKVPQTLLNIY